MSHSLYGFAHQVSSTFNVTFDLFSTFLANLHTLRTFSTHQHQFLSDLKILQSGQLSPSLVHPRDLKQALIKVRRRIKAQHPTYDFVHRDLAYYYEHHLTLFTYTPQSLYLCLSVPFTNQIAQFDLFKVHTFPVPLQTSNHTTPGFTVLDTEFALFAIDPSHQTFIQLPPGALDACQPGRLVQCSQPMFRFSYPSQTCLSALFSGHPTDIIRLCSFQLYPHLHPPPRIFPVGKAEYLFVAPHPHFQTICQGRELQSYSDCRFCHIQLPCGCTLLFEDQQLSPSLSDCSPDLSMLVTLHTINLALLQHLDFAVTEFSPDSLTNHSVTLHFPNITDYVHRFTDIDHNDPNLSLDLHQLADAIHTHRTTYYKPPINQDVALVSLPWDDSENNRLIWILILTCTVAFQFLLLGFLLYKYNRVAGMVALLPVRATASPTGLHVLLTRPPAVPATSLPTPISSVSSLVVSMPLLSIFQACILLLGAYCVYRLFRRLAHFLGFSTSCIFWSASPSASLCAKFITPNGKFLYFPLVSLPHEHNLLTFQPIPEVAFHLTTERCRTSIHFQWNGPLRYTSGHHAHELSFPDVLAVPFYLQPFIRSLSPNSTLSVVLQVRGFATYLELPDQVEASPSGPPSPAAPATPYQRVAHLITRMSPSRARTPPAPPTAPDYSPTKQLLDP